MTGALHLIPSQSHLVAAGPTLPPPPPPRSAAPPREYVLSTRLPRRSASLLLLSLFGTAALPCSPASAFGISGPKEWLKDQKRKASKFILAPIEASRRTLQSAQLILKSDSADDAGEVRNLLNSAARDCVPEDRNSIVAFQSKTGVEVCTFRLLVKNASSLLEDRDPIKLEAEVMLDELIRSFTSLGSLIDISDLQLASDRQKVEAGFMDTMSALDNFELGIKHCLDI